ncbi:MAG TPA: Crp/Fnr family transcriptional regulator [Candidatus Acidoferrales bacterium]|nr:Crp/Fnr family transcriptional regulator [Candidatus Acidoferrales bacterium]
MITQGQCLPLFRRNKLFAGLNDATIIECAKQFTLVHACRRQTVYRQGDPCKQVYCLLQGSVRLSRLAEDGSEFTTGIVGHSDIFGEGALFDDEAFLSTATALSDGIVAVCSAERVRSLVRRYPALSINIAQHFREEQHRALDRLELLSNKPVRERLLAVLRELALQCDVGDAQDGKYELKLTHVEVASLVGSTRETVSSELSKLVRAGLIAKRGRKIFVDLAAHVAA